MSCHFLRLLVSQQTLLSLTISCLLSNWPKWGKGSNLGLVIDEASFSLSLRHIKFVKLVFSFSINFHVGQSKEPWNYGDSPPSFSPSGGLLRPWIHRIVVSSVCTHLKLTHRERISHSEEWRLPGATVGGQARKSEQPWQAEKQEPLSASLTMTTIIPSGCLYMTLSIILPISSQPLYLHSKFIALRLPSGLG